jgi:phosphate transport system substrate-binding protein
MSSPCLPGRRRFAGGLAGLAAPILTAPRLARADLGGRLAIGGTGTAHRTMRLLAEEFRAAHPAVKLELPRSLGSTGGIRALLAGALDIAATSREPNDDERARGVVALTYGRTPFVFVTSHPAPPTDLTAAGAVEILALRRRTWPDGLPIRIVLRPKSDSDSDYVARNFPGAGPALDAAHALQTIQVGTTDQDNLDIAERIPGSFAGTSLCTVLSEQRDLRILNLDGIAPSLATMNSGAYPRSKALHLFSLSSASATALAFLDFIRSPDGARILARNGVAPTAA